MKIRLIALFLVVAYILSSKANSQFANMLVNTEAEYTTVTTKIQKDKDDITKWSGTEKDLEYIKNNFPKDDIETTLLTFIQDIINASYYYNAELTNIALNSDTLSITQDQKLIKLNVTIATKSSADKVNSILKYMKQKPFYYPVTIKSKVDEAKNNEVTTSISYDLWAKYTPVVQTAKSPSDLVKGISDYKNVFGKYTSREEYRKLFDEQGGATGSGTGTGTGDSNSGVSISIEGLDQSEPNSGETIQVENPWGESQTGLDQSASQDSVQVVPNPQEPTQPTEESVYNIIKELGLPFKGNILAKFSPDHNGVKIQVPNNTAVNPIYRGKVVFAANAPEIGNVIIIEHDSKTMTLYAHLSEISVKVGDTVDTKTKIGVTGKDSSGNSVLHYSLSYEDKFVNPE